MTGARSRKSGVTLSFLKSVTAILLVSPLLVFATSSPLIGVSPGTSSGKQVLTSDIDTRCPTFSWASPVAEGTVQLAVFEVSAPKTKSSVQSEVMTEPVIEEALPAGAYSWTPSFDRCLKRGWQYAWSVRSTTEGPAGEWSEPMFFRIADTPSTAEVLAALKILEVSNLLPDMDIGSATPGFGQTDSGELTLETPRASSLVIAPTATGIAAKPGETTGVVVGVHGVSDSTGAGSAGFVGESTAVSSGVIGIYGISASAGGGAGVFENTAGGTILAGYSNGTQVFDVDGNGTFTAVKFAGSGAGITDLGDLDCSAVSIPNLGCVTGSTEIEALSIGPDNLAANSVRGEHIKEGAIRASEIAAGAVTAVHIANGEVGASEIATDAVGSAEIKAGAVSSRAISDGAIGSSHLGANSVTTSVVNPTNVGRLFESRAGCANPGSLVLDQNCLSIACGAGMYKNCTGTCNQVSSLTCGNTLVGVMLDPAMSF